MSFDTEARFPTQLPDATKQFATAFDDPADRDSDTPSQWAGAFAQRAWNEVREIAFQAIGAGTGRVQAAGALSVSWSPLRVRFGDEVVEVEGGSLTVSDNATNYVEIAPSGDVVSNTSGWSAGSVPLAVVEAASGEVTDVADCRAWLSIETGDSHTHTDLSGTTSTSWQIDTASNGPSLRSLSDGEICHIDRRLFIGPQTTDLNGDTWPGASNEGVYGFHQAFMTLTPQLFDGFFLEAKATGPGAWNDVSICGMDVLVRTLDDFVSTNSNPNVVRAVMGSAYYGGAQVVDNGVYGASTCGWYVSSASSPGAWVIGTDAMAIQTDGHVNTIAAVTAYAETWGGSATSVAGLWTWAKADGGTATNAIGLWITQVGGATNNYAILSDTTAPSKLAGPLWLVDSAARPPLRMTARTTPPTGPAAGDIYLDSGANTASRRPSFRQYSGSAWVDLAPPSGASAFTDLSDVPHAYTGLGGRYLRVKSSEDGLEAATPAGAGDMLTSVYDADEDGTVNAADFADAAASAAEADLAYDLDIGALDAETSPTSGDLLVIERQGTRKKIDWDSLPSGGSGGGSSYDPATTLLLHFDGANGSTDVIDSAVGGGAPNVCWCRGSAALTTTSPKFGSACINFSSASDFVRVLGDQVSGLGTHFTIEFWARFGSLPAGTAALWSRKASSGSDDLCYCRYQDSGKLHWNFKSGSTTAGEYTSTSAYAFSTGTWYHIAFVRDGDNTYLFVNGVSQSLTANVAWNAPVTPSLSGRTWMILNSDYDETGGHGGWQMDEFRISRTARWTSNFTPPTEAYSA